MQRKTMKEGMHRKGESKRGRRGSWFSNVRAKLKEFKVILITWKEREGLF